MGVNFAVWGVCYIISVLSHNVMYHGCAVPCVLHYRVLYYKCVLYPGPEAAIAIFYNGTAKIYKKNRWQHMKQ